MEKKSLKILSYNIHKGFKVANRAYVLNAIRDAIRTVHADLIFLQEVVGHHERHSPLMSQFEFLADQLWPHFAYGKNAVYTSGHHGNAILSKYPFSMWENIDISTNKMERRGLLHGVIQIPGQSKPLHAICSHLGLFEVERQTQVHKLCQRIDSHVPHAEPLIVGGDFNDWMGRASGPLEKDLDVREAFKSLHGKHAKTFPSWWPLLKLDRIYLRGVHLQGAWTMAGQPWNDLSDHLALLCEIELPTHHQAAPAS